MSGCRYGDDDYRLRDGVSDDFGEADGVEVDGNEFLRVVRCSECAKTDALDDGRLVCKRFGCFNHVTPPGFFCAAGEERRCRTWG